MKTRILAIDGAYKKDVLGASLSGSGLVVLDTTSNHCVHSECAYEENSTSQRGEINALLLALRYIDNMEGADIAQLVVLTDSMYVKDTITKEWLQRWASNGYFTASGALVKNVDLWKKVEGYVDKLSSRNIEFIVVHIKGHVVPIGEKTGEKILKTDNTGQNLYKATIDKFNTEVKLDKYVDIENAKLTSKMLKAKEASVTNNSFGVSNTRLREYVAMNVTADFTAKLAVAKGTYAIMNPEVRSSAK